MLSCFDVLAQLANIPTIITLYELLRLSKSIREALREALADSKAFIAQIPAGHERTMKDIISKPPSISINIHSR